MYLPSYAHQHQGILLPSHSTTSSIHHLLETSENICRLKESQFANALANIVVALAMAQWSRAGLLLSRPRVRSPAVRSIQFFSRFVSLLTSRKKQIGTPWLTNVTLCLLPGACAKLTSKQKEGLDTFRCCHTMSRVSHEVRTKVSMHQETLLKASPT